MLFAASSFNQDLGAWSVPLVTTANQFNSSGSISKSNYDLLLIGWTGWSGGLGGSSSKSLQSNVLLGMNTQYTLGGDAQGAHDHLTAVKTWTITDLGGI